MADRTEIHLFGDDGRLLYRSDSAGALAELLTPSLSPSIDAPAATFHTVDIPGKIYRKAATSTVRLQLDYSLTLMRTAAEYKLAALDGELRSSDTGLCATAIDRNAVYLRCKTLSQAPFCYSATLYGDGGRHNPEVLKCTPDYRRHMPAFMDVLGFYGIDLPLRDRNGVVKYEIDGSELARSYVLLKIYLEADHFRRTLAITASGLEGLRAQRD